jgi:hypothetical protein
VTQIFVVVNTNTNTHHPTTGLPFNGDLCFRNGYQTANMSEASLYWTLKTAQRLADKLNTGGMDAEFKKRHGLNFHNTLLPDQYIVQTYDVIPA